MKGKKKNKGIKISKRFGYLMNFSMKNDIQPRSINLLEVVFPHDWDFICLVLPENMIICDKRPSKCGKWATLNDLRFDYILRFYYILRCTGLNA